MQEKVLEFWSPAPLLEGDAGKDAAAPADLKKPEAEDLEVSSDSSIGDGSDVEVVGVNAPPPAPRQRRHAVRKIPASKAGLRSPKSKGGSATASRSGSEELGVEDAPNCQEKALALTPGALKGKRRSDWRALEGSDLLRSCPDRSHPLRR